MKRSTVQWTISVPPLLSKEAEQIAQEESRTRSELVREALRKYMEHRSIEQVRRKLTRKFRTLGIRTEQEIEHLVDEGRE